MDFTCETKLLEHMKKKKQSAVVVEIAQSDSSDFEVVELHVHLCDERMEKWFVEKKRFTRIETSFGSVLLPPYKLEYETSIVFGLKSFGPIKWLTYTGIHL